MAFLVMKPALFYHLPPYFSKYLGLPFSSLVVGLCLTEDTNSQPHAKTTLNQREIDCHV